MQEYPREGLPWPKLPVFCRLRKKKTGKLTREVETRTEPRIVVLKIYPIATDIVGCVHGNVAAKFPYPNFFEMYASYFADLVCRTHYPGIIPIENIQTH